MKKWIDDIEKQIDAIEAGEVDAKNLSEVLDKDAPIKLTTDLQNNKVKVGLDIDSETLEVNNGKLKVKAGGSGAKKYLKNYFVTLTFKYNNTDFVFRGVQFSYVSNNNIKYESMGQILQDMGATSTSSYVSFRGGTFAVNNKTYQLNRITLLYDGYVMAPYNTYITNITDNENITTTEISYISATEFECRITEL